MHNLKRYLIQNRRQIRVIIIFIALAIIVWRLLIYYGTNKSNSEVSNTNAYENSSTPSIISNTNSSVLSSESSVTGERIITEKLECDTDVIKKFMDSCNSGNLDEAYNLLSDDCKSELYRDLSEFRETYYNSVFDNSKRLYTIENWVNNIYKVTISEDVLSTGNTSSDNNKQDFITVVGDDLNKKLNINGFISKDEIDVENEFDGVDVKAVNKLQYMDYTEIELEVTNNNEYDVTLDSLQNPETMYLVDSNDIQYPAYTNEISESELFIRAKAKNVIKIKYFFKYGSTKKIEKIIFSNVTDNGGTDRENSVANKIVLNI